MIRAPGNEAIERGDDGRGDLFDGDLRLEIAVGAVPVEFDLDGAAARTSSRSVRAGGDTRSVEAQADSRSAARPSRRAVIGAEVMDGG